MLRALDLGLISTTLHSMMNLHEKRKERVDFILDPLQAMYTLALYSFYPSGSKICVRQNLLMIQPHHYSQGAVRWLNSDSKEDIFHLFHACKRFPSIYGYLQRYRVDDTNLYALIVKYAKKGLHKLNDTYSSSDKLSIQHTIRLYQTMLDNPSILEPDEKRAKRAKESEAARGGGGGGGGGSGGEDELGITSVGRGNGGGDYLGGVHMAGIPGPEGESMPMDMEAVFQNIHTIYTKEHLWIMTNVMRILDKTTPGAPVLSIIEGFGRMFEEKNDDVRRWIQRQMVF
jgi:hypothetical protein